MADRDVTALRAEIEAARQVRTSEQAQARVQERDAELTQAEVTQAEERQRLRGEALQRANAVIRASRARGNVPARLREDVDADRAERPSRPAHPRQTQFVPDYRGGCTLHCGRQLARGEYIWSIRGMSWLKDALWAESRTFASSDFFSVGYGKFAVVYSPEAGALPGGQCGSLAIHHRPDTARQISLQYSIYIKAHDGSWVQWGPTSRNRYDPQSGWPEVVFGPDVHWEGFRPESPPTLGIFGLSHEELISPESEFVVGDELTMKCVLDVRSGQPPVTIPRYPTGELQGTSMSSDMQAFLESGNFSDVQFVVQDEVINAHSQVLCARSEVFRLQLTAGMQESVTKTIKIDDCAANTFRLLLKFLYTDSLTAPEDLAAEVAPNDEDAATERWVVSQYQGLLAVAHKYQVTRLQRLCEAYLIAQFSPKSVCGIAAQALLLQ
ncbi:BPM1, partial [Symbiodinium pilosum]